MPFNLCANEFTEFALVEELTIGSTNAGGLSETWSTRGNLWCKVKDTGGNEPQISGRLKTFKAIEVIANYDANIVATDRLTLDGVVYNIKSVENIDRRGIYMRIMADNGD